MLTFMPLTSQLSLGSPRGPVQRVHRRDLKIRWWTNEQPALTRDQTCKQMDLYHLKMFCLNAHVIEYTQNWGLYYSRSWLYSSSVHLLDESWWICWGNEFHIHQGKQTPILSGLAMSFYKNTAPKTGNKVPVNVYSAACMRQILPFAKSPRIKVSASKKSKRSKLVMFQTWTARTANQTQTDCLGQILPHQGREEQMRKHIE